MSTQVKDNVDESRYELWQGERMIGVAEYVIDGGDRIFTHTEIEPELRQHGYASELIEGALDDMLTKTGERVVAECPYVKEWLEEHPDYAEALTSADE